MSEDVVNQLNSDIANDSEFVPPAPVTSKGVAKKKPFPSWQSQYPFLSKPPKAIPPEKLDRLSTEEWEKLNEKSKWDSIVALRGPDLKSSNTVKFFTSSVIRHRLGGVMRTGGLINNRLPFVILPLGASFSAKDSFDWNHFLGHIYEAAVILRIPIVWVNADIWSKAIGGWEYTAILATALATEDTQFPDGAKEFIEAHLGKSSQLQSPGDYL